MIDQVSRSCPASSVIDLHRVLTELANGIVSRVAWGRSMAERKGRRGSWIL